MAGEDLTQKKCKPCEGGVKPLSKEEAVSHLDSVGAWSLSEDGKSIHINYVMKNFVSAISLMNSIKDVAEAEGHHPDLHLTGYRHLQIEISTHAIGGLSENDFILAAKIDQLPKELKS